MDMSCRWEKRTKETKMEIPSSSRSAVTRQQDNIRAITKLKGSSEKERQDRRTDRWTDGQTDGQTDRQAYRQTDRQTDIETDREMGIQTDRQRNGHRYIDGQTKEWRAIAMTDLFDEILEERKFVLDLRTADDRSEGSLRILQSCVQKLQFRGKELPCDTENLPTLRPTSPCAEKPRDAFRARVGSVCCPERVVHEEVRSHRVQDLRGEVFRIPCLPWMEAEILQEQDFTREQCVLDQGRELVTGA